MKKIAFLIILTALLISCARLPDIVSDTGVNERACLGIFPQGRWQVTHTIEAIVPGGKKKGLIGASVISSQDRTLQCVLMTVEGFVLFSGRYHGKLIVDRAVAPFDRPGFAEGLVNDLMLLFFKPEAPLKKTGVVDGMPACRFMSSTDGATDVIIENHQSWRIHKYSLKQKIERTVEARTKAEKKNPKNILFAENMTLKRHGILGYQLDLQLVDAIPLP